MDKYSKAELEKEVDLVFDAYDKKEKERSDMILALITPDDALLTTVTFAFQEKQGIRKLKRNLIKDLIRKS